MPQSIAKKFGEKIRELRKEKGYSQEKFAYKIQLHRTYIGAVERGEKNITLKNLEKIAESLDVKISAIFSSIEL
jgi:transcriptional regulator with XRE-family HTH domain